MDINEIIGIQSKTVSAIYDSYKKTGDAKPDRRYLGASLVGHECERYLWYYFRDACKQNIDGRIYRLFATGELEEKRLGNDLVSIGCEVHVCNENGEQFALSALGGHLSGHMDGCALGIPEATKTWHVLEFKTHNAKSFAHLVKNGVKKSKPQHYAQMMIYMHLAEMKRALYLARNKDTDALYSERIRWDNRESEDLIDKARRIITSPSPPERIAEKGDFFKCRWCDANSICWGPTSSQDPVFPVASISCRQCCHATPVVENSDGGMWKCEKRGDYIPIQNLCRYHLILPGMITCAEPVDYIKSGIVEESIKFVSGESHEWYHGSFGFSSEELLGLPRSVVEDKIVNEAKQAFNVSVRLSLLDKYSLSSPPNSTVTWTGNKENAIAAWKSMYGDDLVSLDIIDYEDNQDCTIVEVCDNRIAILWKNTMKAEFRASL